MIKTKKHFRVTNSYTTKTIWRWLKKNKFLDIGTEISEHDFGLIIKTVNTELVNSVLEGHDAILPYNMGKIELRKYKPTIEITPEGIKTNLPINWKRTLSLWKDNKEAHKKKTLVRYETNMLFRIMYSRKKAIYKNKSVYQFIPHTSFKKKLSEKVLNNEIDAFLYKAE